MRVLEVNSDFFDIIVNFFESLNVDPPIGFDKLQFIKIDLFLVTQFIDILFFLTEILGLMMDSGLINFIFDNGDHFGELESSGFNLLSFLQAVSFIVVTKKINTILQELESLFKSFDYLLKLTRQLFLVELGKLMDLS